MNAPRIILKSCPKNYSADLDKAASPRDTIARVLKQIRNYDSGIYAGSRRVDTGRLGIPVYLGVCGPAAREVLPVRKQMGKGSSPEQAEASALMELMERFAFFSFWQNNKAFVRATWSEAEAAFGPVLLPVAEMLKSVSDGLDASLARQLLDLVEWQFYPATDLGSGRTVWLPLDWFRMLGEFNGSSAGNACEESLLQGISELVERHVSCIVDRDRPVLPTIDPASCNDSVLRGLITAFDRNGIKLVLKDISLGLAMPTVAALAWDPATFPGSSEIVFTAGTASSPAKAAIRAITEVAQLAGDFCTGSCYEASGLPKFTDPGQFAWLEQGLLVPLAALPDICRPDIRDELSLAVAGLAPLRVFAVETTHPGLGVPCHYTMAPGLQFRERDRNQSLGLFIGRKLAEEAAPDKAEAGLASLGRACPRAHYLPFFEGLLALRKGDSGLAASLFDSAIPLQPDSDAAALACFYSGYALSQTGEWRKAADRLELALQKSPALKAAANLLGVACFKLGDYEGAEACFENALKIDKGSAADLANRGIARKFQGRLDEAREDLMAALELEPGLEFAARQLAELG